MLSNQWDVVSTQEVTNMFKSPNVPCKVVSKGCFQRKMNSTMAELRNQLYVITHLADFYSIGITTQAF